MKSVAFQATFTPWRTSIFGTRVVSGRTPSSPVTAFAPLRTITAASVAPASTLKKNLLGSSDLLVTEICLGTMTWGVQNTEAEAHEQLDFAIKERGVNFIDTAEVYPVPPGENVQPGLTEEYIGTWFAKNPGWREKVVVATKVVGYSTGSRVVANRTVPRAEQPYADGRLDSANIRAAVEGSLRRMQTDYIDLYQTHWPDRYAPLFGRREYNPENERDSIDFKETLLGLKAMINEGKIRTWGVSNETTFGVCELVKYADELGVPRPVTIQNQFCLLNRSFEGDMAEACAKSNYNIGLLPWSVLGGGVLSGKYSRDEKGDLITKGMENARFVKFGAFQSRFIGKTAMKSIEEYKKLAKANNMSMATLAQAWCATRWFIPSTIIGATTMEQLKENIEAFSVKLDEKTLAKIDEIHVERMDPYLSL